MTGDPPVQDEIKNEKAESRNPGDAGNFDRKITDRKMKPDKTTDLGIYDIRYTIYALPLPVRCYLIGHGLELRTLPAHRAVLRSNPVTPSQSEF
jgi:hypothetical protein